MAITREREILGLRAICLCFTASELGPAAGSVKLVGTGIFEGRAKVSVVNGWWKIRDGGDVAGVSGRVGCMESLL